MFVLHIGRHKSGTSSLQRFLAAHRGVLRRHGYLYPRLGGPGANDIAHHGIPHVMREHARDRAKAMDPVTRLETEVEGFSVIRKRGLDDDAAGQTVLLSSEALQNCPPEIVAKVFPPDRTRVVVYLREQVDYIVSAYCQRVHAQLETRTLDDFAVDWLEAVDYLRFVQRWSRAFDREHVVVRIYDRGYLVAGDVRVDLIDVLGLPPSDFVFEDRDQNPSIGGDLLAVKLRLNSLLTSSPEEARRALYEPLRGLAEDHPEFRVKPKIGLELQDHIRRHHRPLNEKLFGVIGSGAEGFRERDLAGEASPAAVPRESLELILDRIAVSTPDYFEAHVLPLRDEMFRHTT